MSEETMADDSSHYEVSLTAGQAFVGFVLLLFSLAAAFMFGIMIGKGQAADRLVVKRDPTVIAESNTVQKAAESRIVELGVPQSDSQESVSIESEGSEIVPVAEDVAVADVAATTESAAAAPVEAREQPAPPVVAAVEVREEKKAAVVTPIEEPRAELKEERKPAVLAQQPKTKPATTPAAATPRETPRKAAPSAPAYAQLLSTSEATTAESLAARLIDAGFTSAYVERSQGEGGMIYRVRVKFASDADARAASTRLRSVAKTEPWITRQ